MSIESPTLRSQIVGSMSQAAPTPPDESEDQPRIVQQIITISGGTNIHISTGNIEIHPKKEGASL